MASKIDKFLKHVFELAGFKLDFKVAEGKRHIRILRIRSYRWFDFRVPEVGSAARK